MILLNFISNRYFKVRKKNKVLGIISNLSLIGIMLGVATLIIVTSVLNGYRAKLIENIIGVNGYMRVVSYNQGIENYQSLSLAISENIKQKNNILPIVDRQAILMYDQVAQGINIKGINPEDLNIIHKISSNIISGDINTIKDNNHIIIGSAIANNLGLNVGDKINIISSSSVSSFIGNIPRIKTFTIGAIFNSGMYLYDNGIAFVNLKIAQNLFLLPNKVNSLEIYSPTNLEVEKYRNIIRKIVPGNLHISDWKSDNMEFISALDTEKAVMFVILSLITIVSAFNIISSLTMLVNDKIKDIAILRTFGVSKNYILKLFIVTGAKIGIYGTTLGVILGLVIAKNIENIRMLIQNIFKINMFNPVVYYLNNLPCQVDLFEVAEIAVITLVISLIATIYPAYKASSIAPSTILKNEG